MGQNDSEIFSRLREIGEGVVRIYRNAGTGAFTYGNDLKYPIPA